MFPKHKIHIIIAFSMNFTPVFMQPSGLHRLCLLSDTLNWKNAQIENVGVTETKYSAEEIPVLSAVEKISPLWRSGLFCTIYLVCVACSYKVPKSKFSAWFDISSLGSSVKIFIHVEAWVMYLSTENFLFLSWKMMQNTVILFQFY